MEDQVIVALKTLRLMTLETEHHRLCDAINGIQDLMESYEDEGRLDEVLQLSKKLPRMYVELEKLMAIERAIKAYEVHKRTS